MATITILLIGLLIGGIAGTLSGLLGIGGGIVIVPMLTSFLGFSPSKAIGTSLAAMLLPVGVMAVRRYAQEGNVDFRVAGMMALGIFLMALVGANANLALGAAWVSRIFGLLLVGVGIKFLLTA